MSKIIQYGGFYGKTLGNLVKKVLADLTVPLVQIVLSKLATNATWYVLDKCERKINGKRDVVAGKEFTLFISNEDMNDI